MAYDPEKYRAKREKVLGVKKRGMGFGLIASAVALVIITGLSMIVIPRSIAHIKNRNLVDAIYKIADNTRIDESLGAALLETAGVRDLTFDHGGQRIVVTFDSRKTDTPSISRAIEKSGMEAVLLNRIGRLQRLAELAEEKELEAL